MTRQEIEKALDEGLKGVGEGIFVVEVVVAGDQAQVTIDGDDRVSVDDCVALSRAVREILKRDLGEEMVDEMSLTVSSAGIGQPLKVQRQYKKLVGRKAELVLEDGRKIVGKVDSVGDEKIVVQLPDKESETLELAEIKTTREHLEFK